MCRELLLPIERVYVDIPRKNSKDTREHEREHIEGRADVGQLQTAPHGWAGSGGGKTCDTWLIGRY